MTKKKYLLIAILGLFFTFALGAHAYVICQDNYRECAWSGDNDTGVHRCFGLVTVCNDGYFCANQGYETCGNGQECGPRVSCEFYASTKCSDGIDNDCDGYVDLSDPNCSRYADDDEGPEPPMCNGACCPPTPPAPSVDVLCNGSQGPCTVANGSSTTVSWASSDANSCSASNAWSGSKPTAGSQSSGAINSTSVFTLTCYGDGGTGQDSVTVQNPPNTAPVTSAVRVTEPNYCSSAPSAFVEWTYADANADPQASYRIQIDDDAAFGSPAIDTGQVACAACRSYLSPATLAFNTTYRARVQTTDSKGAPSNWQSMSLCSGSGCQGGGTSWATPQHPYPSSVDFSWSPTNPSMNQLVQFTTSAVCYALGGSPTTCASWAWTFGDGGSASIQNPTHTYTAEGSFPVTFRVTDAQGYSCPQGAPLTKTVNIQKKIPIWVEVAPR